MYWPSFIHRSLSRRRIVSSAYHLLAPIRRYNKCSGPSASLLSPSKDIVQPEKETSLSWVQIFDESPASYGIDSWGGYVEMIPPKARLPYERVINLENALDYISQGVFTVYYRHSILKLPTEIAKTELNGLRVAKEGVTKMKATMTIGKDLSGTFKVQDNYTKSVASVRFDAGAALRTLKSDGLIKRDDWYIGYMKYLSPRSPLNHATVAHSHRNGTRVLSSFPQPGIKDLMLRLARHIINL